MGGGGEQIHWALVVNQELMREEEKQWAQMKPFSVQRIMSLLRFRKKMVCHVNLL